MQVVIHYSAKSSQKILLAELNYRTEYERVREYRSRLKLGTVMAEQRNTLESDVVLSEAILYRPTT